MKLSFSMLVLGLVVAASEPAFAQGSVAGNDQTVTLSCADSPAVSIAGNHNTVTITGTCSSIALSGNENRITASSATSLLVGGNKNVAAIGRVDAIVVPGNQNKITYEGPLTANKKTRVQKVGNGNAVSRTAPKKR